MDRQHFVETTHDFISHSQAP